MTPQLFLASKSPRRRELLSALGYPVHFVDIDVDETITTPTPASQVAEMLAIRKANAFDTSKLCNNSVLVTADTIVVHNDAILGKPRDRADAERMFNLLSADVHTVYTGVCLKSLTSSIHFTEKTDVWFKPLTTTEIAYYLDNYQYSDKAGSYAIQEWIGMIGVTRIEGCYYNVMGLPLSRLYQELQILLCRSK